jgi:hypothetical protein
VAKEQKLNEGKMNRKDRRANNQPSENPRERRYPGIGAKSLTDQPVRLANIEFTRSSE